jgi:2'-5' RNA ligase
LENILAEMRLFSGIDLPGGVAENIDRLLKLLEPAARINWTPVANLHLTTKFIGEWPEERVPELEEALAGVPRPGPVTIGVRGLGFFPNARSPRVFWAGVDAPQLAGVAAATDRALEPLGIAPEKRAYSPHLTLARIKAPVPLQALRERIGRLASQEFGEFTARRFFLYRSKLSPGGSVYTKISEFPLEK